MKKLPLRYFDDSILRQKALSIDTIDDSIIKLADEMIEIMIAAKGVGLAAPQIGKLLRIFVMRDEIMDATGEFVLGDPEVIINPTLFNPSSEKVSMVEGCLSLPGLHVEVFRPQSIHIRYQNLKGEEIEEELTNFRARVAMHENDHLNGVLIIDRISPKERKKVGSHLQAIKKKYHP